MRLIHTADWQLGKPFGRFEPDVRAALTDARFEAIDAIGKAAAENGAGHVLVAGDVFDTEGPEDRTIVQVVSRMARHGCRWWLLPGNHDYARNGGLWDRVIGKAAPNITVLRDPRPVEIDSGTWILPAPLSHRHNLDDPTSAFDGMETRGAKLRIGLAHGSIRDFGSRGEANNQIAPDRAKLSGLDYLALGDWHGTLEVDSRTWYSGTPETDRFQRDAPGQILLVDIETGRLPTVTPLRTGRFQWLKRDWRINDCAAFEAERQTLWNEIEPSATLLQLAVAGVTSLSERIRVLEILEADVGHQLRYLEARTDDLVAQPSEEDMQLLAVEGVLGSAAQKLNALRESGSADAEARTNYNAARILLTGGEKQVEAARIAAASEAARQRHRKLLGLEEELASAKAARSLAFQSLISPNWMSSTAPSSKAASSLKRGRRGSSWSGHPKASPFKGSPSGSVSRYWMVRRGSNSKAARRLSFAHQRRPPVRLPDWQSRKRRLPISPRSPIRRSVSSSPSASR